MVLSPCVIGIAGLDHLTYGLGVARKGWLRAADIINTLSTAAMAAYFRGEG